MIFTGVSLKIFAGNQSNLNFKRKRSFNFDNFYLSGMRTDLVGLK